MDVQWQILICDRCHVTFSGLRAARTRRQFCSFACKQRSYRARKKAQVAVSPGVDDQRLCQGNGPAIMSVVAVSSQ